MPMPSSHGVPNRPESDRKKLRNLAEKGMAPGAGDDRSLKTKAGPDPIRAGLF
jgi:hypothetical protein